VIAEAAQRAAAYAQRVDYRGADPYDGLASPVLRRLPGSLPRRLATQAVKRAPAGARRPLGIAPMRMAKALGMFAWGYALAGEERWVGERDRLLSELVARRPAGGAWGYEFDVDNRWGFYPAGSPNVPATAPVVEALHLSGSLTGALRADLLAWFERTMVHPAGFFRYTPASDALIHNANLLAARAYHRVGGDPAVIARAVGLTLAEQRADGSWPYGSSHPRLAFSDNFHTVYVLDCLHDLHDVAPAAHDALCGGIGFWVTHLFEPDGHPRYYPGRPGPDDLHNLATALYGLGRLGTLDERAAALVPGALAALLAHQREDGAFRLGRQPVFLRWGQSHAFHALASLMR
jgi:hypothetical protein